MQNPQAQQPDLPSEHTKTQMMDNARMAKRSELFLDDEGVAIEKRCFLLLCGDNDLDGDYLELEARIDIFKNPRDPYVINFSFNLHNTIIEVCNDVIKS